MRLLNVVFTACWLIPSDAFASIIQKVQACDDPTTDPSEAPIIDLGYSRYQGQYNQKFDRYDYKGIRFAAPPKRWQLPEAPKPNRTAVIQAVKQPPRCPQCLPTGFGPEGGGNFTETVLGDEDCLFLNILSPRGATKLPVVVVIHGGGYGAGWAGLEDLSYVSQSVNNSMVIVSTQYRLGAFGFLASADVADQGALNAGLHDIRFALQWVQRYISLFGGDPDEVTIAGESAGGGSVMLMTILNGGTEGNSLFKRAIASSPYFPSQPKFDDDGPTGYYTEFARRAGCLGLNETSISSSKSIFKCLEKADTITLQKANADTTYYGTYGLWPFIPVTDGTLLREQPPKALLSRRVNGQRVLTSNNANEGTLFVPQNITTQSAFEAFIRRTFPRAAETDITALLSAYSIPAVEYTTSPKFDSNGLNPPYATQVSHFAVGWQQASNNLYAEATFICPSHWLATAFSPSSSSSPSSAWHYQFSVPDAFHALDLVPLQADPANITVPSPFDGVFAHGMQSIWGRFITTGNPTLVVTTNETAAAGQKMWRPWGEVVGKRGSGTLDSRAYTLLNVNVTADGKTDWKVADGLAWEGGRWGRCDLWARLGVALLIDVLN
ncbi:Alpha/Beta hydrolase protein [Echria macrotheca]|uniref:Carboxylic ester hydrolase n=1 Tax=Echria macrotheca TaxID=438768 RepID=A0AAJ0FBM4_9PEZI|nr:Alpha/Beta hydrolase protein [Echria macrotheca]